MTTITEILASRGALPMDALDGPVGSWASDEQAVRALLDRGVVSAAQVASARAAQAELPFVELPEYPVDRNAVALVPGAICRRHEVLPIGFKDGRLLLAMVNLADVFALDDVRTVSGRDAMPVMAERSDLLAAIDRYHRADGELNDLSVALEEESAPIEVEAEADDSDAPIVRFVNLIVSQAIQDHASDIHIEPGEHDIRVRYRIDGVLHDMQHAAKSIQNGVVSRLKIMSEIDIAERRRPQDGRMSVRHGGATIDLRVATLPTVWGEKVVMRILDNSQAAVTIDDLFMMPANRARYEHSYNRPHGMILVTGPTGSGKSTTLYATLRSIAKPEVNVITVEDPVEFLLPGVNQVQVNPKAGLTFASALRSILRADPDVVLVGEIRDQETAKIAIEASLTGHLVLSTLHTNDAPSAITRLTEMGVEPFLVGSALESVVAQRLARRLCDRCQESYVPDEQTLERLHFEVGPDGPPEIYRAVGCSHCSNTGYRGRIALQEVMTVSEEIERLAVDRSSSGTIAKAAVAQGMSTLRQDGWVKAKLGFTSIDEILRVAS
ncbi:GspE/PulE family protein [uncultured Amnibacterium sp.]|uniref:GspE/PulE family protein n=1 Tax=uncultured Amnibacterium sp. TaxID=1631851 RepID=UPI0035CA0AF1